MIARRTKTQEIDEVEMKLRSRRVRSLEELMALDDEMPAVCGPSPLAFAARHGLKLSKPYVRFMRDKKAGENAARKVVECRRSAEPIPGWPFSG